MGLSSSARQWALTMPAGSLQQWNFGFTVPGSTSPYPISGATWEYVVRTSATDTGPPLIGLTTTPTAEGALVVTATGALSQVLLEIFPSATQSLAPGIYYHALWQNPGTPSALAVAGGALQIDGAPQP